MKKINKLLLAIVPLTTMAIPAIALVSCGDKTKEVSHVTVSGSKEKTSETGSTTCTFELELAEELKTGETISVTLIKDSVSRQGVAIKLEGEAKTTTKKVTFITSLSYTSNNAEDCWAKFSIEVKCANAGTQVWAQKISDFKHTAKFDTEKHQIVCNVIGMNSVTISSDKTTVNETDVFNISAKNDRAEPINDAKLKITVGDKFIVKALNSIPTETSVVYPDITKQALKTEFEAKGYPFNDNDSINFDLIRIGAYQIQNDHLYSIDATGNVVEVEDENIPKSGILLKNKSDEWEYVDKDWDAFISSCKTAGKYTIYLLNSEYFYKVGGTDVKVEFEIHGILNKAGQKLSALRAYKTEAEGGIKGHGVYYTNIKLDLYNLKINGRNGLFDTSKFDDLSQGFMTSEGLNFTNCDFIGAYTLWYCHATFNSCTFDSTGVYKVTGATTIKNMYPMYIYSNSSGEFNDCTFNSIGKAVKVYHWDEAEDTFTKCTFNLFEPNIPIPGTNNNYTMEECEKPISIDGKNVASGKYSNTKIASCSQNTKWSQIEKQSKTDNLCWVYSYSTDGTYSNTVKINDNIAKVDEVPA